MKTSTGKYIPLISAITFALTLVMVTTQNASAQTNTFPASGNTGVGTTSPTYKLQVNGNGGTGGDSVLVTDSNTASTAVDIANTSSGAKKWRLQSVGSSASGRVGNFELVEMGADLKALVVQPGGNVGIGTTSPGYSLDVQSNAQWAARFKKTDSTHGGIIVESAASYNPNIALSVNGTIKWYMNNNVANGDTLQFWESNGLYPRFTLTQSGNVGIGATSPLQKLQVGTNTATGTTTPDAISLGATYSSSARANPKLRVFDDNAGSVYGIGVSDHQFDFMAPVSARYVWSVNGTEKMRLDDSGNLTVSGNIAAKYQDVAEWVPSTQKLSSGTVVVLDQTRTNEVIASSQAYDTRVAGVVSAQPGIALGESGNGKVLVATTGRVRVKVDASRAPIHIGDLLVTSDIAGVAMKSEAVNLGGVQLHRPGTLIGKALEPLEKGSGEILVLLSLQ
jgi:hypothetical protein